MKLWVWKNIQTGITRKSTYIAEYCKENGISKVIVGDITVIREDNDLKVLTNQKIHALPYHQMYIELQY